MIISIKSHQTTLIVAYVIERGVHVHCEFKDISDLVCVRWHEIGLGFLLVILDGGLCDFKSNNRFLSVEESNGRCLQTSSPYHLTATTMRFLSFFSKPNTSFSLQTHYPSLSP